jgi:type II secretory pathway pseudopilin PulG
MYNQYSFETENYQENENLSQRIVNFIKSITGVETLVVLFVVITLISITIWGFIGQSEKNKDLQKQTDFEVNIIPALIEFYKNSGTGVESTKAYPVAKCSSDLNEVDYEFTLRKTLAGEFKELDTFNYLTKEKFPVDREGIYTLNFNERKIPYRCPEKLNLSTSKNNLPIYEDGFKSCNFSSLNNFNNCYLYTSSGNGDKFQLAYYSVSDKCFIVYSKFRSENITLDVSCN